MEALVWVIAARFICGYQPPELDLTPLLGVGTILLVAYSLLLQTPVGG
jgi:hypothetical protein